jgi:hypothetical protein
MSPSNQILDTGFVVNLVKGSAWMNYVCVPVSILEWLEL